MELTIDPYFDSLCPDLTEAELKLLGESIDADGCREPIVTWANHDDTILDGHNRYRICKSDGHKFTTKALRFETKEDAARWILRNQMGRRNLTDGQRAMMAAKLSNLKRGDNQHSKEDTQICGTSQAEIAEEFAVSPRTISSAKRVLDKGSKELQKAVEQGDVAPSVAAEVAELPKAEQRKIVKAGPAAVKEAAKEHKAEKKAEPKKGKPKGGTDFTPSDWETPAEEVKDALGNAVPGDLLPVFRLADEFTEQMKCLSAVKAWVNRIVDLPGGKFLSGVASACKTDIDNARAAIKHCKPHTVCPRCKSKLPKVANCEACRHTGFVTAEVLDRIPKDLR